MPELTERDISYQTDTGEMIGYFCAPESAAGKKLPGVLVFHGAHGLNEQVIVSSKRIARLGYAVLAADLWGNRHKPKGPGEFGPLMSRLTDNRPLWFELMVTARNALCAQPEVDNTKIGAAGYCFGGASVLEFVRLGGVLAAGISLHGGLDVVGDDWSRAIEGTHILVATGSEDPMAGPPDRLRLEAEMNDAGLNWETCVYGGVRHAFTEPDTPETPPFAKYDARADTRSFQAMSHLFEMALSSRGENSR